MRSRQIAVSIIGNYSLKNRGDEILLKGTIRLFQYLFKKNVKFNVYLLQPDYDAKFFNEEERKNVRFFPPIISFTENRRRSIYLLIWNILYRLFRSNSLLKLLNKDELLKISALLQSDYIVYRSIDQLSDIFGFTVFLKNYLQVIFCYNLGKKLLLHSQTIHLKGKGIRNFIAKLLIKILSNKVKITLREKFSEEWFIKNGIRYFDLIPPPSIVITYEMMKKYYRDETHKDRIKILITPRVSTLRNKVKRKHMIRLVESLLSKYPTLEVTFWGQSYEEKFNDDDYIEINNIIRNLSSYKDRIKILDIRNKSLLDTLKLLVDFDLVISERFITAVNALSLGIPCIIVDPYGGKNMGIAKLFGFEKYAYPIEHLEPPVIVEKIEEILANKKQLQEFLRRKAEELYRDVIIKTWRLIKAVDTNN